MERILYVTTLSRTLNAFLIPHIEKLLNEGKTVDCACFIDEEIDKKLIGRGVRFYHIPFTRNPLNPLNFKAFINLIKIQKKFEYDIVHVHTPIAALYGRLLKIKFPELKTIYTVHGFHFYAGAPILNWTIYYPIERIMSHYTNTMITMNNEDYERAQTFNVEKTYKINGVGVNLSAYNQNLFNRDEVRRKLNLKHDDFVIIMIAEVNKNKNHKQMIGAVEVLKRKDINVKVLCAGDGPLLKELKEDIETKGLNEHIRFLGPRTDISELITACDMGMLLSYREGLPRNIMELMACKKPVIGTNIRGIRDLIDNGYNGFLVRVSDSRETAQKIEELYKNRRQLQQLGNNAFNSIKKYDVEKVIENLIEVYS